MNTDAYKARLEEEKQTLERELASVGRKNPSNPNDWEAVPQSAETEADPNDEASEQEGYGTNQAILTDLENRYNDVKSALTRIDDGSYGTCSLGGEAIEPARLDADPAAATCIAHA